MLKGRARSRGGLSRRLVEPTFWIEQPTTLADVRTTRYPEPRKRHLSTMLYKWSEVVCFQLPFWQFGCAVRADQSLSARAIRQVREFVSFALLLLMQAGRVF